LEIEGPVWDARKTGCKSEKLEEMSTAHAPTILTPEERLSRRRLILQDAVSLLTLFLITAILFALTLLLFHSFTNHRQELGARWKARGENALSAGHPLVAIDDLRSALAYIPNRQTEIELATALAQAGKVQEATAYFTTLRESAPGDGTINLELARLAARAGHESEAILYYQSALDGTWQGNGYDQRRHVRLEMAQYLIGRHEYNLARNQLLIAAGNAPDNPGIKIEIGSLLEQANAARDALTIYQTLIARRDPPLAALEGAGRTAFSLGMYRLANDDLGRAMGNGAASKLPEKQAAADRYMLDVSQRVLLLYPSFDLSPRQRAQRVLALRNIARERVTTCKAANPSGVSGLDELSARWGQVPGALTVSKLEQQPDLEQTLIQLAYDTETTTAAGCGSPTGDDAILLRIARNPNAIDQQS
jgi:tetratricopeptide (TPR) repeat protein